MTDADEPIRSEPNPKWVRAHLDGEVVVDSRRSLLVWEHRWYPVWYLPEADVDERLLAAAEADGVTRRVASLPEHVHIPFDRVDAWFEEDVEVFVHPRSPEVRVDALASSRHVVIEVDGVVVADSHRPVLLFETNLPTRHYLPKADVRMDLLTPTASESACPYKGWAHYWSVQVSPDSPVHDDLAWGYRTPLPESAQVAGLVCFYDEKVDVIVDGERVDRPRTKFA